METHQHGRFSTESNMKNGVRGDVVDEGEAYHCGAEEKRRVLPTFDLIFKEICLCGYHRENTLDWRRKKGTRKTINNVHDLETF